MGFGGAGRGGRRGGVGPFAEEVLHALGCLGRLEGVLLHTWVEGGVFGGYRGGDKTKKRANVNVRTRGRGYVHREESKTDGATTHCRLKTVHCRLGM